MWGWRGGGSLPHICNGSDRGRVVLEEGGVWGVRAGVAKERTHSVRKHRAANTIPGSTRAHEDGHVQDQSPPPPQGSHISTADCQQWSSTIPRAPGPENWALTPRGPPQPRPETAPPRRSATPAQPQRLPSACWVSRQQAAGASRALGCRRGLPNGHGRRGTQGTRQGKRGRGDGAREVWGGGGGGGPRAPRQWRGECENPHGDQCVIIRMAALQSWSQ